MSTYSTRYSIKDLEALSGIKAHTIRMWEKRYNLLVPKRTDTNIRYYDDDQLRYLLNVSIMVDMGYRIAYISSLSGDEMHREIKEYFEEHGDQCIGVQLKSSINGLLSAMIDVDEPRFNAVFDRNRSELGFRAAVTDLIYPFLERVGIMWGVNEINPAQEHFVSHLIRRKIESEIDRLKVPDSGGKRFLLFLPENELHEIGLLLAHYLLRSNGFYTCYLGPNVPYRDMKSVAERINPDVLLTLFVAALPKAEILEYVEALSTDFPDKTVLIGGRKTLFKGCEVPANIQLIHELRELEKFMAG